MSRRTMKSRITSPGVGARAPTRRITPTEFQLQNLQLPVSEARFERAMEMAARDMGGTYNHSTGRIMLPKEWLRPGDRSFPTDIQVLYRKFPCGFLIKDVDQDNPAAGYPCVSFDVIPNVIGDPRRSRVYRSFQGDAGSSKVLFGKFLGWLKIISRTIKRYRDRAAEGSPMPFSRIAAKILPASSVERLAYRWLLNIRKTGAQESGSNDPTDY